MRKTFQNEDAARRAAAAKWQQLQRGAAEFSITLARGRAELYPEMHATVTGFKPDIDAQDWIISKVNMMLMAMDSLHSLTLKQKFLTGSQKLNRMIASSTPVGSHHYVQMSTLRRYGSYSYQ